MPDFEHKARFGNAHVQDDTSIAIRVEADWHYGGRRLVWIPQSQIDDDSEVWRKGQKGEIVINEGMAVEKGLI